MSTPITFLETLIKHLKAITAFNPADEIAPVAILWPDGERDWEPLIPRLRQHLPLITLGPYAPKERTGPVAWIRCMLARALPDKLAPNTIPIVYLPGVSSRALCNGEQRPRGLEPLAELRYRSVMWITSDQYDWTVIGFFQNTDHGLGVQVRDDPFTLKAMRRVLPVLSDLTLDRLREESPWKVKDFEALVEAGISALIDLGESEEREFKSTARWHMVDGKFDSTLEHVILKTVAGFLNSKRGGTLLIGVEDNHNICGIELDFQTFSKPEMRNCDGYERWLMTLLLNMYGQEFASVIHITFHDAGSHKVCRVDLDPAPSPAFVKEKKDGKEEDIFYLRTGNATNKLGIRAALNYYKTRWC